MIIGNLYESFQHPQSAFECIPIGDWLMSYKLPEYIPALQDAGYDNTDFLLGISNEVGT